MYQFLLTNLSLLSSRLNVPLCINFSTLLVMVLLFILLSVAFSHSDYKKNTHKILLKMIFNVAKCNSCLVNLQSMHPAVFKICRVAAGAWVAMCLYVTSSRHIYICSADLCASLPSMDHYFGRHIILLVLLIFVDHCFDCLFYQFSAQPFPPLIGIQFMVGKFLH